MYHKNKMMRTVLNFEGGALRKDLKLDMDAVIQFETDSE